MNQQTQQTGQIEAGYYKARALAGSEQYAQHPETGNEQIAVDFDVPQLGRALTVFFYFTEAATPYAMEKLRACGWQGNDISRLVGIDANEVEVQVKYETWQGKTRMKVDVASGGGGRVQLENQMDERMKRAFAARIRGLIGGAPVPQQGQRPAQAASGQQRPAAQGNGPPRQAPRQPPAPQYDPGGDPGFDDNDPIPF